MIQEKNDETREPLAKSPVEPANPLQKPVKAFEYVAQNLKQGINAQSWSTYIKPALIVATIMFFVFLGAMAHRLFSSRPPTVSTAAIVKQPEKAEVEVPVPEQNNQQETAGEKPDTITPASRDTGEVKPEKDVMALYREEMKLKTMRAAIVIAEGANVRSGPYLEAQRILTIVKGELLTVAGEKTDQTGMKWYKVILYNSREGWIADKVVTITTIK